MAEKKAARRAVPFTLEIQGTRKEYYIRTLVRREAMLVMHTVIRPVLLTIIDLVKDKAAGASRMKTDMAPKDMIVAFKNLIEAADFETIETIAKALFDQATVDGDEIDFEDYFGEHPLELYSATYQALRLNYPDVFSVLQPMIRAASKVLKDQANENKVPEPPLTD